ncbi:MAG: HAD-IA family hydrolase [Methylococcales bacterium]|jgi:putative hydrolase of the HAD superfamily|nr:hypothetical protein [Methylococcaceae bacterium]HIL40110.1 hypothetical protein [Methylococcales bacterium]
MATPLSVQAIVFDLGGVLIQLGDRLIKNEWRTTESSHDIVGDSWLLSKTAQDFERGLITPFDFAEKIIAEMSLNITPTLFIEHFAQWPIGPYPTIFNTLNQLRHRFTLGIFSNTNAIHWPRLLNEMSLAGKVDYYFASHLIHLAKPDPKAFTFVANTMGLEPNTILFLDDNPYNIDSARQVGFIAHQVIGFDSTLRCLHRLGAL